MRREDKVAIVTGGGSGIGRGISLRLAEEGAAVMVADLDLEAATRVAREIVDRHGRAAGVQVDVRKPEAAQAMVDATVSAFGGVDILVNNAGVAKIVPFFDTTEDDWDLIFDVNCKGMLFCSQAAAKTMIAQGRGGKIVNLASQAGRRGEALVLAYCASKAAVISMTQSMALALAEHKINVNAVAPGIVDTPMWDQIDEEFAKFMHVEIGEPKRRAIAAIPIGRVEQPADVAGAVAFLASSDADYITQQCLNVDGGNWPS